MKIQGPILLALAALLAQPVMAVEMMNDSDMGGVHIESGNVLNIVGPTAAGGDEPPIQQTSGTQSSLTMALNLRNADSNRPEEDNIRRDRNILSLVFPQLTLEVPAQRRVPSPNSEGSTSFVILPGQQLIQSTPVMIDNRPALRLSIDTRIEQLEWDNVRFPQQVVFDNGNTTIMRGFNFQARGLLREAAGN
ncbi:hypothetical protein DES49_1371 [Halospina denitrificans]|uniref:Uncharacterized protein n=1 Tax=Halospina denitrificans TaxID=332522 RepID=A0A4R7JYG0_9GAMM|nr:hypothetical protein [Halospina denitrificans]TDT43551.1 hypothetical protein DES49_1371 [Halospina denitrificans]